MRKRKLFEKWKQKRMVPHEAIRLVQCCKVSLVLFPPSLQLSPPFPLFGYVETRIFWKHNSQAHTARIFLALNPPLQRRKHFFFFVLFRARENTKNTFFHPFVKWHAHRPEMWHRTNSSQHLSKSHENAKHYQRKEFFQTSPLPPPPKFPHPDK